MAYRFKINVILPFKSYDRVNDIYVIDFILFNIFSLWQWLCFYNAFVTLTLFQYMCKLFYISVLLFVHMFYFQLHALYFIICPI